MREPVASNVADPAPDLKYDRERAIEGKTPDRVWQDHNARYQFARPLAVGRRVLDAACGSGYGSFGLASHGATSVVGVDIGEDAVAFARGRYPRANLEYQVADVAHLPFADASFEVVTSFETIEHVDDAEVALAELTRVLRPSGILLISTPNRIVTSPTKQRHEQPNNKFHKVEYTEREFDALLEGKYDVLARFGQRAMPGLLYNPLLVRVGLRFMPYGYAPKHGSPQLAPLQSGWQPRYFVYVCQKR